MEAFVAFALTAFSVVMAYRMGSMMGGLRCHTCVLRAQAALMNRSRSPGGIEKKPAYQWSEQFDAILNPANPSPERSFGFVNFLREVFSFRSWNPDLIPMPRPTSAEDLIKLLEKGDDEPDGV